MNKEIEKTEIITNSKKVVSILRAYMRSSEFVSVKIENSKAKWTTVANIINWYNKQGHNINKLWFGKTLNKAEREGYYVTSKVTRVNGKPTLVYRNDKERI
jgi:hypothetical protein